MNKSIKRLGAWCVLFVMLLSFFYTFIGVEKNKVSSATISNKLEVTFLNVSMGDCAFVQYDDVQILIDSGPVRSGNKDYGVLGAPEIISFIKEEMSSKGDTELDYVIATHGDDDHIGNMAEILDGLTVGGYSIKNIVDFDSLYYEAFYLAKYCQSEYNKTALQTIFEEKSNNPSYDLSSTSKVPYNYSGTQAMSSYRPKRDALVNSGTKYYCVAERIPDSIPYDELFQHGKSTPKTFKHGDLEIQILYNENYFDLLNNNEMTKKISSEYAYYVNSKSVCVQFKLGKSKALFTGDIEETHDMCAETNLVETHKESGTIENVTLYKAAHHGSNTSNSFNLIKHIKPKYVAISALANSQDGAKRWGFPKQEVLDNLRAVTEKIYITAYLDEIKQDCSYYGNITFYIDDNENVEVQTSVKEDDDYQVIYDDNNQILDLVDTKWFKENRTTKVEATVLSGYKSENCAYFNNGTIIKYGNKEILIDCGAVSNIGADATTTSHLVEKVKEYCLDGVLEYVIVTSPRDCNLSQMPDIIANRKVKAKGILSSFKIGLLIDFGEVSDPSKGCDNSFFASYNTARQKLNRQEAEDVASKNGGNIEIANGLTLTILQNEYYGRKLSKIRDASICSLVDFYGVRMLFMGDVGEDGEKSVVNNNDLSNISFFRTYDFSSSDMNGKILLDEIKSSDLFIATTGIAGKKGFCEVALSKALVKRLMSYSKNIYFSTVLLENGQYQDTCGDITFCVVAKNGDIVTKYIDCSVNEVELRETAYYEGLF